MPDQTLTTTHSTRIPGIDADATPLLSIGLGLTGLALGLRPRLAPLPLALTALAAALYRDPQRVTPDAPDTIFAPADGTVLAIDEVYEHRFVHSDCLRIAIVTSPLDVPINRSPAAGQVRYFATVSGAYRSVYNLAAAEHNERTYIGLDTAWGPILLVQIAGPVARRIVSKVQVGDVLQAGERIGTVRFGARTDLIVQRDAVHAAVKIGDRIIAGRSRVARVASFE